MARKSSRLGVILYVAMATTTLLTSPVAASKPKLETEELEEQIDEFIGALLACRKFTAANIAVVKGNETLVAKGYGVVDMETNATVTNTTLFGIASLSKAFTEALLGIVLDQSSQGYTWDSPVRTILGDEFYFYDALRTNNATLRDLLTHRMGFPPYNNIRHQSGLDREILAHKIRYLKPTIPFRKEFKYNNIMYGLLTHVTEVLGGDTWENLMKQHIFRPLGMTSSDFTHMVDIYRPDLVKTYQVDYDGELRLISPEYHSYWGKIGGSGAIVSNAVDLTKWLKAQLNYGVSEAGERVIPSDVIGESHTRFESIAETSSDEAFLQPQSPVSYSHFEYGLGWRIGFYRGWRIILHTGTSMGYLAQITQVPDLDIAIHSSFSGDDPGHTGRRLLHIYVMDLLMGESPWLNVTSACEFPQTGKYRSQYSRGGGSSSDGVHWDANFDQYVGTYGNFGFGNVTFYVNETTGGLMMGYGDLGRWELEAINGEDHSFSSRGIDHVWIWSFGSIAFSRADGGGTGSMDQVYIPGLESASPPTFVRDLRMDEAPPPPPLECSERVSNAFVASGSVVFCATFSLLSLLSQSY